MRCGLLVPDMVVAVGFAVLVLFLLLLTPSGMEVEDPVLDVGGAFLGSSGPEELTFAAFNPEALLLVVGAADIDVI